MNRGSIALLVALTVLTLFSLALNAAILLTLLEAREMALVGVAEVRDELAMLATESFTYTFTFEDEIPFQSDFPIQDTFTVPIQTAVPVNTTFAVPIDLGITTYNLKVPVNTVFPIDMEFSVPISMSVPVDLSVPVHIEVPVEIPIAETPFMPYLDRADAQLEALEQRLKDPFGLGELP
jgi:hypothetical protein